MTICGCVSVEMVDDDKYKVRETEPSPARYSDRDVRMEKPFDLVFADASLDADQNAITALPLTLETSQNEVFNDTVQDSADANDDGAGDANAKRTIARIRRQRSSAISTAHSVPTANTTVPSPTAQA